MEGEVARSDTNEVGEYEVTVTSELHAQAERTKKQKRGGLHPGGGSVLLKRKKQKHPALRERRWFVLERPRRDTNGGSDAFAKPRVERW